MLKLRIVISVLLLLLTAATPADDLEQQMRSQLANLQKDIAGQMDAARKSLAAAQTLSTSESLAVQTLQEGLA
jgi:hypothetical protein